jgi:hypothetical protein
MTGSLLLLWTVIGVACRVAPPNRERVWRASSAKDCEGKDEDTQETASVQSGCDEVRVILEDSGSVVSEVVLHKQARSNDTRDRRSLSLLETE